MPKFYEIAILCAVAVMMAACGKGTPDLEKPGGGDDNNGPGPGARTVSIDYLKSLYVSAPVTINENIRITGRIVSTDEYGNFYKTLCIEDETGGIAVRLDNDGIFKTYLYGCNLTVSCNSLILGSYGGALQLGQSSLDGTYPVDPIENQMIASHLVLDAESCGEPLPARLGIEELSPRYINCFVRLDGVQFVDQERSMLWCEDGEDTNRHIVDRRGNILAVRTSSHADFAYHELPDGSGFITGILGYFNRSYQLVLNSPPYLTMQDGRF